MADASPQIDPTRLSVDQLAKLLSAVAKQRVPAERIAADVEGGAPTNSDGTLNLVHYAAWLVKEMAAAAGKTHGR